MIQRTEHFPTPLDARPPAGRADAVTHPGLAPIVLFVYNRPAHTRRCLDALRRNREFADSPLYIFCDGPRTLDDEPAVAEVQAIANSLGHPNTVVRASQQNQGLANSVIAGLNAVLADHERVIVVEDDLIVGPSFLGYLNEALQRYRDEPQVMQVAAHMYPIEPVTAHDALFLPLASSWGWATWRRAWQHFDASMQHYGTLTRDPARRRRFNLDAPLPYFEFLHRQHVGRADSWYIRWYLSIFMNDGLVLYPRHSHVQNQGFDGSGVHCGVGGSPYDTPGELPRQPGSRFPPPAICAPSLHRVRAFLTQQNRWHRRALRRAHALFHAWRTRLNGLSPG
jgi:hypothetical protein